VSVHADDLEESTRFYEELFGMERLPTAKFPDPVLWLRLGEQQLHLFESDEDTPTPRQHVSFDVEDFDAVYGKAKAMGILDSRAFGSPLRSHPMGWVQMYLRDPAGNLVEVDWPDKSTLSEETQAEILPLESTVGQTGDAARATVFTA
jgi:catechol 2,3-dioxygenase-like lactoylglutathione lyase family enzyme